MSVRGYLLLLAALVAALVAVQLAQPQPLDLRVRLERSGDAPFDAEVFFASLPEWLGQPVEPVGVPAFERLEDSTLTGLTYLVLAESVQPDAAEAARLLRFVETGNTLVVLTHLLEGPLAAGLLPPDTTRRGPEADLPVPDGLDLDVPESAVLVDSYYGDYSTFEGFAQGVTQGALEPDTLRLGAPGVRGDYVFPVEVSGHEVVGLDPARSEILGTAVWSWENGDVDEMVTLARIRHGRGEVLVSSTPLALSNAALTGDGDGPAYAAALVAALPDQPVLWDDYQKPYRENAQTPLRFVLQTPALRGAYLLLLLAGVLYVAFRGRRWQRAVPVVAPPPNAQREFARTVGRLHFIHRDDRALAHRMDAHVRDRLRSDLRLTEPALDDETARLAAARAGVPEAEALALFAALRRVRQRPDADDLVRLDARVARFFRHV